MKKIFTYFLFIFISMGVSAQSLILIYDGEELSNGAEIIYQKIGEYEDQEVKISVKNNTDQTLNVKARRTVISEAANSINSICWAGSCWPSNVDETPAQVLEPNSTTGWSEDPSFPYDDRFKPTYIFDPEVKEVTTVKYLLFDVDNPDINVEVTVKFDPNKMLVGIENSLKANQSVSFIAGRPEITYNLDESKRLVMYHITGQVAGECVLPSGSGSMALPFNLRQGVYIYVVKDSNKVYNTGKTVIR